MRHSPDHPDPVQPGTTGIGHPIDAYLDGEACGSAQAALEARLREDPLLAAEMALQRRVDESIRRLFSPPAILDQAPAGGAEAGPIGRSIAGAPHRRRLLSPPLAAAAVLALAGALGYWAVLGSPLSPPPPHAPAPVVYQRVVAGGFEPQWVCEDEPAFIAYTRDLFGSSWVVAPQPGLKLVGWRSASDLLGPDAGLLLAERAGRRIVVAIDHRRNDRRIRGGDGLRVFRRRLGDLVMYEVSPLEVPAVIGHVEAR